MVRRRLATMFQTYRAIRLLQRLIDVDDPVSLDWVIATFVEVLPQTPPDHHDHGVIVNNLGIALHLRYERLGDARDLEESLRLRRMAVDIATPETRPGRLNNLAAAIGLRYQRTRDLADLSAGVRVAAAAVASEPRNALYLSTFADLLGRRFDAGGADGDLDAMVGAASGAVAFAGKDNPNLALYLGRLGAARGMRWRRDGNPEDLDGAITAARAALTAMASSTYRHRAGRLPAITAKVDGFSRRLQPAYRGSLLPGDPGPLGFDATPGENPDRAGRLFNLGLLLIERYEHAGAADDRADALGLFAEVAAADTAPARVRLAAAHLRARLLESTSGGAGSAEAEDSGGGAALEDGTGLGSGAGLDGGAGSGGVVGAVLSAYEEAVSLLPLLAWRGIGQRDQQHLLRVHAALGRDAAAAAIAAGEPERAVELLEQGRGVYWAQLLDTRTDLSALEVAAPELAAELSATRRVLESAAAPGEGHRAARRFDELVAEVRALPPSESLPHPAEFLRPPVLSRLLPPDGAGPVVVVVAGRSRCDALIVRSAGVTVVPLPTVTADEISRVALAFDPTRENPAREDSAREDPARENAAREEPARDDDAVARTLDWLWREIASPVLAHVESGSRVWWCPTGLLTVLPLHAAAPADGGPGVPDLVVSSYTPTLRALASARSRGASAKPARMLVAGLPETPGQGALPAAGLELRLLRGMVRPSTVLEGPAAGRAALLDELPRHRWFHAGCHGTQNLADPSTGGLVPWDWETAGLVSVVDLADALHHDGELAFLSACRTATGGTANPDEAITVAAAMQHAGWRHVIGTLWSVPDSAAATVTRGFYSRVVVDGVPEPVDAAVALHETLLRLRARNPDRPSQWAAFLHFGP